MISVAFGVCAAALLQGESRAHSCGEWFEPQTIGPQEQPAVVFGSPQVVPPMRVRFVLTDGASELREKHMRINHGWRWLAFPYPEHARGAWQQEADSLECSPGARGWIQIPSHEVRPRGWYDGKYTRFPWPKRPHFTEVEMVAVTIGGFARVTLQRQDLRKFAEHDLVVEVSQGWRTALKWQPKSPHR